MKKYLSSLLLALCMTLSLMPQVLAADEAQLAVSGLARTETGLSCQVNTTGAETGSYILAAVYEPSAEDSGVPGKMLFMVAEQLADGQTSVPLTLAPVSDTDLVRIILTNGAYRPLDQKQISRPAASDTAADEAAAVSFNQQLQAMIARPEFLNAAAEAEMEAQAADNPYVYKRLIVSVEGALPAVSQFGDPQVVLNSAAGYAFLQFSSEKDTRECAEYLAKFSTVRYVEPDQLVKGGPQDTGSYLGSDDAEHRSWGVEQIHADLMSAYLKANNGAPVTVAVVDSGVDASHPFLSGRLVAGYDFVENDDVPQDEHSHGTHVSGTVVDCTPDCIKVMPVRVLGPTGGGTAVGVSLGIQYAADNGAQVINLSLGGGHSNYIDDAVYYALSKGVTVVVAAGNDYGNVMSHCPAHILSAITVAATNSSRQYADFSNYGEAVDVAAPGVQINSSIPGGGFESESGTSMASPHAAAAAAMIKSGYPDKTPEEIQEAMKVTAADLGDPGWDAHYGYGLIDLEPFTSGKWPEGRSQEPEPVAHTYELFEQGMTWDEAKAYCEALGGHLMTVTSEEEQAKLEELLQTGKKNSYWMGGTRAENGQFVWITGESFTYTHWASGMPDHHHGTEDSLMVYRNAHPTNSGKFGQWNDLDRDGTCLAETFFGLSNFGFICEWDGERPGQEPPPREDGIFAVLYTDGELVFQNNNQPDGNRTYIAVYPVDGAVLQDDEIGSDYADWYGRRKEIKKVTIADKIQPTTTALWFHGCENLTEVSGLEYLDTSAVTNMSHMFSDCYSLTVLDVSGFDTGSVTNMSHMFYDCRNLMNLDLRSFDTSRVTDMSNMFYGCGALTRIYASDSFVVDQVTNSMKMFGDCVSVVGTYGTGYDSSHVDKAYARLDNAPSAPGYFTDITVVPGKANVYLYDDGELVFQISGIPDARRTLVASYVIDVLKREMNSEYALWYDHRSEIRTVTFADLIQPLASSQWFHGCVNLDTINHLENLDTRAVTDMSYMFSECSSLTALDLSGLNTANVTNMSSMFQDCSGLVSLNVSGFDMSGVTTVNSMFQGCASLTSLELGAFDTSNVSNMRNLFRGCASLRSLDLTGFETGAAQDMSGMFAESGLVSLDVSGFRTGSVTNMTGMFRDCTALTTIYSTRGAFNTEAVTRSNDMFAGSVNLVGGRGTAYDASHLDKEYARIDYGTRMPGYFTDPNLIVVSFDPNDDDTDPASGTMDEQYFDLGSGDSLTANAYARENYVFLGWNTRADGSGTSYTDQAYIEPTADTVLYAQWEYVKFAVSFKPNDDADAPATGTMEDQYFRKDIGGNLAANAYERKDYAFLGWNTRADGSGTSYADQAYIKPVEDMVLYAQWEYTKYVVSFEANDDDSAPASGTMEKQYFTKGSGGNLTANAYTRDGHEFLSWNTLADGSGTSYADQAYIEPASDMTLYAQWDSEPTENMYVILYGDGELVFQWSDTPESGRSVTKVYVTDKDGYSDNRDQQNNYRAWHNEASQITAVNFLKQIHPTDVAQWFQNCENLTELRNLGNLDTGLVTDMSMMFEGCASLTELDLRTFRTESVTTFQAMFKDCLDLQSVDLSSFDTSAATSMKDMFSGCESLESILVSGKYVTSQITDTNGGTHMFMDCYSVMGGSGTTYDRNYTDISRAHIDKGTSNPGYFTDKEAGLLVP